MSLVLAKNERIITAFAEAASGPGWANAVIWVIIQNMATGNIRQECIQPEDQTLEIYALFKVSQAAHEAMVKAVEKIV